MSHSISTMAHFKYIKNIAYKTIFYLLWYSYTFKPLEGLKTAGNGLRSDSMIEGMDVIYYIIQILN